LLMLEPEKGSWDIEAYDTKARFASYWHQINEIVSHYPHRVLEVGIGTGFVSNYLKKYYCRYLEVTTVDITEKYDQPDILTSVLTMDFKEDPFDLAHYDLVSCFQVLEHLPFSSFPEALQKLRKASSHYVIVSLPDRRKKLRISLPFFREKTFRLPFNRKEMDKEHCWEIEDLQQIRDIFAECLLEILKEYPIYENDNRMFICKRRDGK